MSDDGRRDRESILLAILIGVFTALVILLAVVLFVRSGGNEDEAATTAPPTTTSAATNTTASSAGTPATTAPATTVPPTTATVTTAPVTSTSTIAAPTTTTTTVPFTGSTDWQVCGTAGSDAGTVSDVRFAQREGFTRVVFDFTGGVPACSVGYADPNTLAVVIHPMDIANPFAAGIFDGSGRLPVGTVSVIRVDAGGMGGGSGEWQFTIELSGTREFSLFTLEGPSRLAIDIGD